MTAITPIIIVIIGKMSYAPSLMFQPKNMAEIPKNSKLNPTINETSPIENIGNMINIKPRISDNIHANLVTAIGYHIHLVYICSNYYLSLCLI